MLLKLGLSMVLHVCLCFLRFESTVEIIIIVNIAAVLRKVIVVHLTMEISYLTNGVTRSASNTV